MNQGNGRKNIWYLLGMAIGVAAIIIGIVLLQQKFYSVTGLDRITFGGDFYTEIYEASRRIHGVLSNLNDLIEYVKRGFGILFILFGAVDIVVFGSKLSFGAKKAAEPAPAAPAAAAQPETELPPVHDEETSAE